MSAEPHAPRGRGFWAAFAIGWGLMGIGAWILVDAKKGLRGAIDVAVWIAGGHAVHDLLVAPAVFAVGLLVARLVGVRWRAPLHAGLAASAIVLAVAYPALGGFGRKRRNPSVLPLDYTTATLTVLGVVWGLVVIWLAARLARARRTGRASSR